MLYLTTDGGGSGREVVCAEKGNYHCILHDKDTNKKYGWDSVFANKGTCWNSSVISK